MLIYASLRSKKIGTQNKACQQTCSTTLGNLKFGNYQKKYLSLLDVVRTWIPPGTILDSNVPGKFSDLKNLIFEFVGLDSLDLGI